MMEVCNCEMELSYMVVEKNGSCKNNLYIEFTGSRTTIFVVKVFLLGYEIAT